jgi:hypothetical protein
MPLAKLEGVGARASTVGCLELWHRNQTVKRAADTATRAEGAIERTLAPRLEELAGKIRGLRGELGQFDR